VLARSECILLGTPPPPPHTHTQNNTDTNTNTNTHLLAVSPPGHGLAQLGDAHVLVQLNNDAIGDLQVRPPGF